MAVLPPSSRSDYSVLYTGCTSPRDLSDLHSQIVLQFVIQYKLKPIGDNYDFWMAVYRVLHNNVQVSVQKI